MTVHYATERIFILLTLTNSGFALTILYHNSRRLMPMAQSYSDNTCGLSLHLIKPQQPASAVHAPG